MEQSCQEPQVQLMKQLVHYLEPSLLNPQVCPEETRQVKEMVKEGLMERENLQVV